MTTPVNSTTASTAADPTSSVPSAELAGFSPEMLLEYCGTMLSGLDGQIDQLMNQQTAQNNEEKVLTDLQSALGQIASPPQNQSDMNSTISAYQTAIAALPPTDPVAVQLGQQLSSFESQYNPTVSPSALQSAVNSVANDMLTNQGNVPSDIQKVTPTYPSASQWQSLLSSVGNIASDVQNDSKMQFLQLQDYCSQEQDAVEQATNLMSKNDQVYLDEIKNVGS
jgi:hypothetical protein